MLLPATCREAHTLPEKDLDSLAVGHQAGQACLMDYRLG